MPFPPLLLSCNMYSINLLPPPLYLYYFFLPSHASFDTVMKYTCVHTHLTLDLSLAYFVLHNDFSVPCTAMKIQCFSFQLNKILLCVWNTIRNINLFICGWTSRLVAFPSCCKYCNSKHEYIHISVGCLFRFPWVYTQYAISGPYVNSILDVLKKKSTPDYYSRCISLHCCQQCKRKSFPFHCHQQLFKFAFLMTAMLTEVR